VLLDILSGYSLLLQPGNILAVLGGTILGIIIGAIPALDSAVGAALVVPLTYAMSPGQALILLTCLYFGAIYGGQIPAILFRIPGSSEAVMTAIEGYELAKQGQADRALGYGLLCSAIGSVIGVIALSTLTPLLAQFALSFSPAEYFALGVLGLSTISALTSQSVVKGLIAGLLGLLCATVGIDAVTGIPRFTFGWSTLMAGIDFIPAVIGLFAASEVYKQVAQGFPTGEGNLSVLGERIRVRLPNWREMMALNGVTVRSSLIGLWVGILPGIGAATAAILAYSQTARFAKRPDLIGKGSIEALAAAETANNAAGPAAMIPLLALGIPGSATTAVMLGAFLLHGLQAGPLFLVTQRDLSFTIFAAGMAGTLAFFLLGFVAPAPFVQLLRLPPRSLAISILAFSAAGAGAIGGLRTIQVMFIFAILGYILQECGYPVAPIVLGIILGPIVEQSLRRALIMTNYDVMAVFTRPITAVLLLLSVLSIVAPFLGWGLGTKKSAAKNQ
jgi:putative tricarboxylic transport membrane protein